MAPKTGYVKHSTPKAARIPTLADIAWASGFIEGEGSFRKRHSPQSGSHREVESIGVQQVERESLERLKAIFGGSIGHVTSRAKRAQGVRARDAWAWSAYGTRARGILLTSYHFLSGWRQQQVHVCLENWR